MESEGLGREWINEQLKANRQATRKLGSRTWVLLRWQVLMFGIGIVLLLGAFLAVYHNNLL